MKITSIELFKANIQLKQVFTTSLGSRDLTQNIFLRLKTDNGLEGWGECAPNPKINGETIDTCMIVGKNLGKLLLGQDPSHHQKIMDTMDLAIFGNTSIKSAFDIACYDLASKAQDLPLFQYLGAKKPLKKKIYTDYTVSVSNIEKMTADALKIKDQGFPSIKVKLGDGKADDIQRIKTIREAVGNNIELRVDANQGWKVNEAINILNHLAQYDVQYCEEPINRRNYPKLKKIKAKSKTKIMADESLFDHYDAQKLIKGNHCDLFNIKLGKSSGLYKALKIIKAAEDVGMDMQIGGFLESRIVVTANAHLAHSSDHIKYFDFDSPLLHKTNPIIGGITYQHDWEVSLLDAPGLGLTVDEAFLQSCESLSINSD